MRELKQNEKLTTISGRSVTVLGEIGRGGQGIVYRVVCGGKERALKWYFPGAVRDAKQRKLFFDNLMDNMLDGVPVGAQDMFLWPLDVVDQMQDAGFGYVMELIPDGFVEFSQFQLRQRFSSYRARVDAMIHIAQGFRVLHNAGYKYQDINNGNVFIRPEDGSVLICDNDNVSRGNRANGVIGKDRFMAPEVAMGSKLPDQTTDRYSLAVLLFILACKEHPLLGSRVLSMHILSEEKQAQVFGSDPLFIFDPEDESNRPCPKRQAQVIANWRAVPPHVRALFVRAFLRGTMHYEAGSYGAPRVTELEWIEALLSWRNSLVACTCERQPEWYTQRLPATCPRCGRALAVAYRLCTEQGSLPTPLGMRLTRFEMGHRSVEASEQYVAEVVANPRTPDDPAAYGLRNLTDKPWLCILPDKSRIQVQPGRALQMMDGMVIACGAERRDRFILRRIQDGSVKQ